MDTEVNDCLIPILAAAAAESTVLDLQDILQRFGFDNVCAILFGYDPASLVSSLPQVRFMQSFEEAPAKDSGIFIPCFGEPNASSTLDPKR